MADPPTEPRPVLEPAVVRIGPDRTLLDPPWGMRGCAVAHLWIDETVPGGWARVAWPLEAASSRPVAPLDLHLGHVLELAQGSARCHALYACVAHADERRVVLVPAASALEAVSMARHAVDVWRANELAAVEDEWRQRISSKRRMDRAPN